MLAILTDLAAATADVARFVGADPPDLFPVANATAAANAVIVSVLQQNHQRGVQGLGSQSHPRWWSWPWRLLRRRRRRGRPVVLMTSLTYPAVRGRGALVYRRAVGQYSPRRQAHCSDALQPGVLRCNQGGGPSSLLPAPCSEGEGSEGEGPMASTGPQFPAFACR